MFLSRALFVVFVWCVVIVQVDAFGRKIFKKIERGASKTFKGLTGGGIGSQAAESLSNINIKTTLDSNFNIQTTHDILVRTPEILAGLEAASRAIQNARLKVGLDAETIAVLDNGLTTVKYLTREMKDIVADVSVTAKGLGLNLENGLADLGATATSRAAESIADSLDKLDEMFDKHGPTLLEAIELTNRGVENVGGGTMKVFVSGILAMGLLTAAVCLFGFSLYCVSSPDQQLKSTSVGGLVAIGWAVLAVLVWLLFQHSGLAVTHNFFHFPAMSATATEAAGSSTELQALNAQLAAIAAENKKLSTTVASLVCASPSLSLINVITIYIT